MKKGFYRQNDNLTEEERLELKADIEILEQDVDELIENSKETIQKIEDVYLVEEQDKRISELEEHCADTRKTARYEQTREDYQDVMLDALTLENDSKKVTIANQSGVDINLSTSKEDSYAQLKTIKGNTIINHNQEPYKEIILNPVDINESDNKKVILEGQTADGGLIDVYLEGETLVNVSDTKEETLISSEKVLTEIEENTYQIEEDILRPSVKGNTLVNVSEENETLVDMLQTGSVVEKHDIGDNARITKLSGRTMVNLCDQKDPIPLTKSYTVETDNHIALEGEYDGKAKPYVYGNTLVNLAPNYEIDFTADGTWHSMFLCRPQSTLPSINPKIIQDVKPNTTYTVLINIVENTLNHYLHLNNFDNVASVWQEIIRVYQGEVGLKKFVFTTPSDLTDKDVILRTQLSNTATEGRILIKDVIFLEGDYTDKPIQYFEGLQSSFEDGYVPENLASVNEFNFSYNNNTNRLITLYEGSAIDSFTIYGDVIKNATTNNVGVSLEITLSDNLYENIIYRKLISPSEIGDIKCYCYNEIGIIKIRLYIDNSDYIAGNEAKVANIILLEGDYTNYDFSDYDSANVGKYKVEYKVTGKNKMSSIIEVGDINNNTGDNKVSTTTVRSADYIEVKSNTKYTISNDMGYASYTYEYDSSYNFISLYRHRDGALTFTTTSNTKYIKFRSIDERSENNTNVKYQIEEGDTPTSYEPYKEYTKTLYLNSPLLEGDSIEVSGNNIYHVHKYKEVVLDGSESWVKHNADGLRNTIGMEYRIPTKYYEGNGTVIDIICDKLPSITADDSYNTNSIGVASRHDLVRLRFDSSTVGGIDLDSMKQWLSNNPITVVYKLASPTYEKISSNDNLYIDSYVNGHLDFDSAVPIEKVAFNETVTKLRYIKGSTNYTIQFHSDNDGIIYSVWLGGVFADNITVKKGVNRIQGISVEQPSVWFTLHGIGCNISNIVVTEAIDEEFGYFSGLQSSFEDGYDEESGKYKVEYKVTGKNKVNPQWILDSGIATLNADGSFTLNGTLEQHHMGKIHLKAGTYTTSASGIHQSFHVFWNGNDNSFHNERNTHTFTEDVELTYYIAQGTFDNVNVKWQLEEGEVATSYEPYKEYTKTLYLNSPLLEGDSIEVSGNNIVHIHTRDRQLLNGSENGFNQSGEWLYGSQDNNTVWFELVSNKLNSNAQWVNKPVHCDRFPYIHNLVDEGYEDVEGIQTNGSIRIRINKSRLSTLDVDGLKQWLANNPTMVEYTIRTPTYEVISSNDNLYIDSYVNGHLDFNSVVPVKRVEFKCFSTNLTYLKPNTQYLVQFEADNDGNLLTSYIGSQGKKDVSLNFNKGLVKFNITNSEGSSTYFALRGTGANISNIVVTEAIDEEFGYFEGMTSVFESNYITNNVKDYTNVYMKEATYINNIYEIKWGANINQSALRPKVGAFNYKPNTTYTIIVDIIENTCNQQLGLSSFNAPIVTWEKQSLYNFALLGKSAVTITTTTDMSVQKGNEYAHEIYFGIWGEGGDLSTGLKFKYWVLEGDYTGYDLDKLINVIDKYRMKYQVRNASNRFGKGGKL